MAVQAWKRRLACEWSILRLFPDLEQCELWGRPFQKSGFLWTFTFADPEGRENCNEARKRFQSFNVWARRHGYRYVWSLERGKKSGHYHYHCVTDQYWSSKTLWRVLKQWGFGQLDVKEVLRERLVYIAKYVGKQRLTWPIPKGVRLWGVCGFTGCKVNRIEFKEKTLTVIPNIEEFPTRGKRTWKIAGQQVAAQCIHPRRFEESDYRDYDMNITKENILHIGQLLAGGKILAVGEYRTMTARELQFTDKDTQQKKTRKLVEHGIEVGDKQLSVTEWLPDDANLSAVKRPCEKGEPVVVEVSGFSRQWGITAESVKSLASFNGKLS